MGNIKLGQKVWVVPNDPYGRRKYYEAEVIKVGRKYFEVADANRRQFNLTDLREFSQGNYKWRVSLTEQEILDESLFTLLLSKIKDRFSIYGKPNIGLPELKQIATILGISYKE